MTSSLPRSPRGSALLLTLGLFSCSPEGDSSPTPGACSVVGCGNGVVVTAATVDGTWPDGTYEARLTVDGQTLTCHAVMDASVRSNQSTTLASCGLDIMMYFDAARDCTSPSGCLPVANHHQLLVESRTFSSALHITLTSGDQTLLDQDVSPTIQTYEPNGHECGPTCQMSTSTLAVSPGSTGSR